jgi:hypothetical protein
MHRTAQEDGAPDRAPTDDAAGHPRPAASSRSALSVRSLSDKREPTMPIWTEYTLKGSGAKGVIVLSDLQEFLEVLHDADVSADSSFEADVRFGSSRLTMLTLKVPVRHTDPSEATG